jgi:hypothetical protein
MIAIWCFCCSSLSQSGLPINNMSRWSSHECVTSLMVYPRRWSTLMIKKCYINRWGRLCANSRCASPSPFLYDGALYDSDRRLDICPWCFVPTPHVSLWALHIHYEGLCTHSCSPWGIHDRSYTTKEVQECYNEYKKDGQPIGVSVPWHEGRITGKGTTRKKHSMMRVMKG